MLDLDRKLNSGAQRLGVTLSAEQQQQLLDYLQLLARWNRQFNLTAVRDINQMLPRHILDSLAVLPYVQGPRVLDIGTGAGLPGIVLAIARPDLACTLVDSNGKKTRFVTQAKIQLGLDNVEVVQARAETLTIQAETVISRAFTDVARFSALCAAYIAPQGRMLAMLGQAADSAWQPDSGLHISQALALNIPAVVGARHLMILEPNACSNRATSDT